MLLSIDTVASYQMEWFGIRCDFDCCSTMYGGEFPPEYCSKAGIVGVYFCFIYLTLYVPFVLIGIGEWGKLLVDWDEFWDSVISSCSWLGLNMPLARVWAYLFSKWLLTLLLRSWCPSLSFDLLLLLSALKSSESEPEESSELDASRTKVLYWRLARIRSWGEN